MIWTTWIVSFRLMHLGAPTSDCAREGERGLRLLKEHATCGRLISYTAWCLHHSGNSKKAYDLIIRNWRRIRWTATEFYLVSRYASKVNAWEIAAAALSTALTGSREYHASAFLDSDLELLLRHAAMGDLSERVALAFGDPRFQHALEGVGQGSGEIPLDYLMLSRVPGEFRSHLKLDSASALFWLHPMAPASVRDGYLKWQRSEVRRNCFYADRAIARSAQFILDHQLEWAIAAARDGNFLGARCHCHVCPGPKTPRTCQPSKSICGPSGSITFSTMRAASCWWIRNSSPNAKRLFTPRTERASRKPVICWTTLETPARKARFSDCALHGLR